MAMTMAEAERAVDRAWYGAILQGVIALVFALVAVLGGREFTFGGWLTLAAALPPFGLAWGLARRSPAAAALLLALLLVELAASAAAGRFASLPLGLAFAYVYVRGLQGALAFHRIRREAAALPEESRVAAV